MNPEQYALALLVGGVTGAGLVVTVYTLGVSKGVIIQYRLQGFGNLPSGLTMSQR